MHIYWARQKEREWVVGFYKTCFVYKNSKNKTHENYRPILQAGETFPEGQIGKMGKTAMKILSLKDEEFYEVKIKNFIKTESYILWSVYDSMMLCIDE